MYSHRSTTSEFDSKSQGHGPETPHSDMKSILVQWRNEIFDEVRSSINEFNTKFQQTKETMDLIKQHLKVNTHNLNEIEEKLSEIERKTGENIKSRGSESNYETSPRSQKMEGSPQKSIEKAELDEQLIAKLKVEINEQFEKELEKYRIASTEETRKNLMQFENDMAVAVEARLKDISDHLNNRIAPVENEIAHFKIPDNLPTEETIKHLIENNVQLSMQSLKEQILALENVTENLSKEQQSKSYTS